MKLTYTSNQIAEIVGAKHIGPTQMVVSVSYDSRKIKAGKSILFVAIDGPKRSGESFIKAANENGCSIFLCKNQAELNGENTFLIHPNPLKALQQLARFHRSQFSYPVIAITGSLGKTVFKEWAFELLSPDFSVVRSPKSFNSQLGVALSLLEMHKDAQIALIEVGIDAPNEMEVLERMVQPTLGVFTHFGKTHRENFSNEEQHLAEKLKLFKHTQLTFVSQQMEVIKDELPGNFQLVPSKKLIDQNDYRSEMYDLLFALSRYFQLSEETIKKRISKLSPVALRMETFEGINGNTIINDTYNLDIEALREALFYQDSISKGKENLVIIGTEDEALKSNISQILIEFNRNKFIFLQKGDAIPWSEIHNSCVLIKANRSFELEKQVAFGRAIKHRTVVEINLEAIKHNVNYFKSNLPKSTKLLCMVKASSYGSGAERVAQFLQNQSVDYFGVAFADEGVSLREEGITLPIIVMNPDPEHSVSIIENNLEPALYDFEQLDQFIRVCIERGITNYPVHLKFDTGMHRLGFAPSDKNQVLNRVLAQPEISVKGIYSHLSDADNFESDAFTQTQIHKFEDVVSYFRAHLSEEFIAHLLNSEGALRFPNQSFDMVRLGIALYGYTENHQLKKHLQESVSWFSAVSQVKKIQANEFVGYGCSFQAPKEMEIAIIPVGYADGFRRSLSNGVGSVLINQEKCSVLGRVCMDMIMVDVTDKHVQINDTVEIIGKEQTMTEFSKQMNTIPYEVMTSLSRRMHRVYVGE